ncbi:MAG: hypothetical protein CSA13_02385 [Clostridiales bacterium]|nr:MAG: hypothetical protein CSA13_02385 [Clostridiales bacterium]
MKNIKLNLGLILIVNTVILFSVTFAAIDYYQKNYIFDKAISSLQNETDYLINEKEFLGHDDETRYFAVDLLFVEDMGALDDYYFLEQEKYFYSLYEKGELIDDEIIKTTNEHGQYYVLLKHVPANIFYDEMSVKEKNNASMPVIFYTDITFATNLVNRLNKIFSAMMLIAIVVEGIVGIYLGTRFEKSQQKLKHFFQNASEQ